MNSRIRTKLFRCVQCVYTHTHYNRHQALQLQEVFPSDSVPTRSSAYGAGFGIIDMPHRGEPINHKRIIPLQVRSVKAFSLSFKRFKYSPASISCKLWKSCFNLFKSLCVFPLILPVEVFIVKRKDIGFLISIKLVSFTMPMFWVLFRM